MTDLRKAVADHVCGHCGHVVGEGRGCPACAGLRAALDAPEGVDVAGWLEAEAEKYASGMKGSWHHAKAECLRDAAREYRRTHAGRAAPGGGGLHCDGCEAPRREGEDCTPECPSVCCDHVPCPGLPAHPEPGEAPACPACGGMGTYAAQHDIPHPIGDAKGGTAPCTVCGGTGRKEAR